ncbi:PYM1 protein, partial [Catharus fuscescens]|nr:PYM1 protein [Catharus fuscescens]
YENKYVKFFRSKPELPPGLNPDPTPSPPSRAPSDPSPSLSKTARRNLKRKEKRKQQQELKNQEGEKQQKLKNEEGEDGLSSTLEKIDLGGGGGGKKEEKKLENSDLSTERSRRMKSLRKKLRQVQELQQRLEQGGIPQPTKEQLEKLGRRKALEEELRGLEMDS